MPGATRPRATAALRHRDFALMWGGQIVSFVGNGVFTVALPLEALNLTGSSLDLGLVVGARTVPTVAVLLVGGTVVDRMPRRLVMLASDCTCALAVTLVAVLITTGLATMWLLAALSAFFGLADAFFMPASTAITADVLPPDALVSGSSLSSLSQSLGMFLLGPLAGGVVVAFTGTVWAFGVDAISFAVSAACLAVMRPPRRIAAAGSSVLAGIREGLSYCRSQPWLWWSMAAVGWANFVSYVPLGVLEPLMVRQVFHAGAVTLGVMYSASGVGGALASLIAGRLPAPRRPVLAIWAAWAGAGLAAVVLGAAPWPWLAVIFAGLTWSGVTYGNVQWFPLIQREVPTELLGRVSSVDWMLSLGLTPVGAAMAGIAATLIGARLTLVIGGVAAAAAGGILLIPAVTEPDRRPAAMHV
ncbi:MAG: MFS transporter [Actinobacteria bacterium]|nr:MFS transporter [Actinomycetota bacterium]